jgi:hypothetical protein
VWTESHTTQQIKKKRERDNVFLPGWTFFVRNLPWCCFVWCQHRYCHHFFLVVADKYFGHHQLTQAAARTQTNKIYVGFEVLTAVVTKSSIFWYITLHSPLRVNQRFSALHLLSHWYLSRHILPWRWRQYVPPKHQFTFNGLHAVILQELVP